MPTIPRYPDDIWTDEVLLDPHPHYRALRDLGPVVWLDAQQMYAVPRYTETRVVLGDAHFDGRQRATLAQHVDVQVAANPWQPGYPRRSYGQAEQLPQPGGLRPRPTVALWHARA